MGLIPGKIVNLGGTEYVLPPLNFRMVRQFTEDGSLNKAKECLEQPTAENLAAACRVFHAALSRNYPDKALAQIEEWLDHGLFAFNAPALWGHIKPEERASGEAPRQ